MSSSAESPPAGWYPDPAGSGGQRYWDGGNWSQVTRPSNAAPADYVPQEDQAASQSSLDQAHTTQRTESGQARWAPTSSELGMARQPVLAGFWWRVLAAILDSLILVIPMGLLMLVILPGPVDEVLQYFNDTMNASLNAGALPAEPAGAIASINLFSAVVVFLYRTVFVALKGGTLGKLILGLRVLRVDAAVGTTPPWGTSALRAAAAGLLGWIALIGLLDVLVMLFTPKKQTLHDIVARTIVYKK